MYFLDEDFQSGMFAEIGFEAGDELLLYFVGRQTCHVNVVSVHIGDLAVRPDFHVIADLLEPFKCLGATHGNGPEVDRQDIIRSDDILGDTPLFRKHTVFFDFAELGDPRKIFLCCFWLASDSVCVASYCWMGTPGIPSS
jgi:hypothetical protein